MGSSRSRTEFEVVCVPSENVVVGDADGPASKPPVRSYEVELE